MLHFDRKCEPSPPASLPSSGRKWLRGDSLLLVPGRPHQAGCPKFGPGERPELPRAPRNAKKPEGCRGEAPPLPGSRLQPSPSRIGFLHKSAAGRKGCALERAGPCAHIRARGSQIRAKPLVTPKFINRRWRPRLGRGAREPRSRCTVLPTQGSGERGAGPLGEVSPEEGAAGDH